jgi:hypothetical protein
VGHRIPPGEIIPDGKANARDKPAHNDTNEAGFRIERTIGTSGVWAEIGTVSNNVTTFTDVAVRGGTSYPYRIRSWNDAGNSAYSNVRAVNPPCRTKGHT